VAANQFLPHISNKVHTVIENGAKMNIKTMKRFGLIVIAILAV